MKSPIPDYLQAVLDSARSVTGGAPASYIETLAKADTSKMAVALAMVDGNVYSAGDDRVEFSMQSISKAFVYAMAIEDVGLPRVLAKIGVEPSGDAFNQLSLERGTNRPVNPMINAGAITAHSLLAGASAEERCERVLRGLSLLAGRPLRVDEAVYQAELRAADRNTAIAYMLKAAGVIAGDPREVVRGYTRQCAVTADVRDLALMAATLANGGVHPVSGARAIPQASVRQVLSVMTTCGMYDAAGDWVSNVGIPAKSGVAGGIIGALPGQVGIATFAPSLDERGNSVRGVAICERLSRDMGLHMMDVSQIAGATVRTAVATVVPEPDDDDDDRHRQVIIFNLRGAVRFPGSERLSRALVRELGAPDPDDPGSGRYAGACAVVISLRDVYSLNVVARRILLESIERLAVEERTVVVVDPTGVLQLDESIATGRAARARVVRSETEARDHIGGKGCSALLIQDRW